MTKSKNCITTLKMDEKIRNLARRHGINMSFICRRAINDEIMLCVDKERRKKVKSYTATLVPFEVDDIVFPDDCSEVDVE